MNNLAQDESEETESQMTEKPLQSDQLPANVVFKDADLAGIEESLKLEAKNVEMQLHQDIIIMFLAFTKCDHIHTDYLKNYLEDVGFAKSSLEIACNSAQHSRAHNNGVAYH